MDTLVSARAIPDAASVHCGSRAASIQPHLKTRRTSMHRTLRLRFAQVVLDGIFYDARCLGEWRKISDKVAWNTHGQAVIFSPAEVVDARGL
jgi:hypothetical protein